MTSPARSAASARERSLASPAVLELAVLFFDTVSHFFLIIDQLCSDLRIFARNDLRSKEARVRRAGFADGHGCHRNTGRHLDCRKQGIESFQTRRVDGDADYGQRRA